MEKNEEELLPIGSIVTIKGLKRYMVIMGYKMKAEDDTKIYDYLGCVYPIGAVSNDALLMFNTNIIDKVIFEGYSDEKSKQFRKDIYKNVGVDK